MHCASANAVFEGSRLWRYKHDTSLYDTRIYSSAQVLYKNSEFAGGLSHRSQPRHFFVLCTSCISLMQLASFFYERKKENKEMDGGNLLARRSLRKAQTACAINMQPQSTRSPDCIDLRGYSARTWQRFSACQGLNKVRFFLAGKTCENNYSAAFLRALVVRRHISHWTARSYSLIRTVGCPIFLVHSS